MATGKQEARTVQQCGDQEPGGRVAFDHQKAANRAHRHGEMRGIERSRPRQSKCGAGFQWWAFLMEIISILKLSFSLAKLANDCNHR